MMAAEHGTYARYSSRSSPCRCGECRAAKAAYMRAKRARARKYAGRLISEHGRNFVPDIKHGIAGWKDHLCRCEVCTEAAREEYRRRRARIAAADEVA